MISLSQSSVCFLQARFSRCAPHHNHHHPPKRRRLLTSQTGNLHHSSNPSSKSSTVHLTPLSTLSNLPCAQQGEPWLFQKWNDAIGNAAQAASLLLRD